MSRSRSIARVTHAAVVTALLVASFVALTVVAPSRAATVPAGTIVFVRDHNVWIARSDGSGARQITTGGSYGDQWFSPSQSDSGIVVASRGQLIYRMDQWGRVLNTLDPPPLRNSAGQPMDGVPVQVAISPDGARIAYTFVTYSCPVGTSCSTRYATGYTSATRLTPPEQSGTTYFAHPSWVGTTRTLQSGGYGSEMNLHDVGSTTARHWFDDSDYADPSTDLSDGEVSPDGTRLALVRGYGSDTQIVWYDVTGDVRTGTTVPVPTALCATSTAAGFASPTWSPDSQSLAWQEPDGVWLKTVAGDCDSPQPRLLLPGASEPDWSAAALSTTRPSTTPAPIALRALGPVRVLGTAKVGKRLTAKLPAWSTQPGSVRVQWLRNGRAIAGATRPTYKVGRADRRKRVAVRVTAVRGASRVVLTSASVRVR
ncbi:hypothetical protein GCM10009798_26720 [Nocardioides panacihumi]|uniref:Ig-like domain-containing protein n=1 Tax=Nocardioides panacihumi TaxID=400774 RepID=A0ABP5CL59_9ACTN